MTRWLLRLVRGPQLDRQLDAELRDHVERLVADYMRGGMNEADARRKALIVVGGVEQMKEQCRDIRGTIWVEEIGRDIAYMVRQLRRQPAFWSVVVITLVVGIATSTSMFAIVNGVLLRPLPYRESERLVSITDVGFRGVYVELRQHSKTMDIGAFMPRARMSLTGRGEPIRLEASLADSNLFDVLGVEAQIGRRFVAADVRPGAPPVVILGYGLWQQRFGGDSAIVGQPLTLDGVPHTVTGVMSADFRVPSGVDIWLPLVIDAASQDPANQADLWANGANMVARLRTGIALAQARQEVHALVPPLRDHFPWSMPADFGQTATAVPLLEQIVGPVRPMLRVLFASVIAVLLILCVNVANLLLTRGLGRERELAIRGAVGGTRARLVRQLIMESLTVAVLAGVLGIAASFALLELTVALIPADVPRAESVVMDAWVIAFALGMSVVTGLFFGIAPAIRATKSGLRSPMGIGGSTQLQVSERRASRLLATAEFALAVMLVVSAALLVKSLWNLLSVDPGFRAEQLVTANVAPPRQRYSKPDVHMRFVDDVLTRLRGMPGVRSAAAGYAAPFAGGQFGSVFSIEGRPDPLTKSGDWAMADVRTSVTADYHRVLSVPILEGRAFDESDRADAPRVAIVSRSLARAYWGVTSPVGVRIRFPGGPDAPWITIVGVAADIKWNNLGEEQNWATGAPVAGFLRTLYAPLAQTPFVGLDGVRLLLRTDTGPERIAANLRAVVHALDSDAPVTDIKSGEAAIAQSVARPRFTAFLLALFAGVALFLGAIGVYGVLAYAVGRRTQEFGVRLALGASGRDLLGGVLTEGARLTLAGVALGLAGAFVVTRALSGLLFGVAPVDPGIFGGVALLFVVVGLLASYLPARRAMRVDPVAALQTE
jgi:putative ABC transport system permease protein